MNPVNLENAYKFFKKFPTSHVFHRLPSHYKKYIIGLFEDATPVHYIPEPKEWIVCPRTGEKKRVVDVPIPLLFPKQADEGLWGGEGIVKGLIKFKHHKPKYAKRYPYFWVPVVKRVVVRSEILDKHISVVVTDRTLDLIDEAYGFDNYILKTRPIDLRSQMGLKLRREMILTLIHKTTYTNDPKKQEEIYEKYKEFIVPEEEVEWIGLTLAEAMQKQKEKELAQARAIYPLKKIYRKELVKSLQEMKDLKASEGDMDDLKQSWFNKWNPFSKDKSRDELQPKT